MCEALSIAWKYLIAFTEALGASRSSLFAKRLIQLLKHAEMMQKITSPAPIPQDVWTHVLDGRVSEPFVAPPSIVTLTLLHASVDFYDEKRMVHFEIAPFASTLCDKLGRTFTLRDPFGEMSHLSCLNISQRLAAWRRELSQQVAQEGACFLLLVGDSLGFHLLPPHIARTSFRAVLDLARRAQTEAASLFAETINRWYRVDENGPRPTDYSLELALADADQERSVAQFQTDYPIMLYGLMGLCADIADVQPLSLLEEIVRIVVYDNPRAASNVIVLNRTMSNALSHAITEPLAGNFTDFYKGFQDRLRIIKTELVAKLSSVRVINGKGMWGPEKVVPKHTNPELIEEFAQKFSSMLSSDILALPVSGSQHALLSNVDVHHARIRSFAKIAMPRRALTAAITAYLSDLANDRPAHPLVVHGDDSTDKSTAISFALLESVNQLSDAGAVLIVRDLGAARAEVSLWNVLSSMCTQLALALSACPKTAPASLTELCGHYSWLLSLASQQASIVIVLLNVQLLLPDPSFAHIVLDTLLPATLPPHVRVVVSTTPTIVTGHDDVNVLSILRRRIEVGSAYVDVTSFDAPDADGIANLLSQSGRCLIKPHMSKAVSFLKADKPSSLLVSLTISLVQHWRSYDPVGETTAQLTSTGSDALSSILEVFMLYIERVHGEDLVTCAISLLCCAYEGLSDREMTDLLSTLCQTFGFLLIFI